MAILVTMDSSFSTKLSARACGRKTLHPTNSSLSDGIEAIQAEKYQIACGEMGSLC